MERPYEIVMQVVAVDISPDRLPRVRLGHGGSTLELRDLSHDTAAEFAKYIGKDMFVTVRPTLATAAEVK